LFPPKTSTCLYRGKTIVWCILPQSGKRIAIDPDPIPTGGIVLDAERYAPGVTPCATVLTGEQRNELDTLGNPRKRYVPHAATCEIVNPETDYDDSPPIDWVPWTEAEDAPVFVGAHGPVMHDLFDVTTARRVR